MLTFIFELLVPATVKMHEHAWKSHHFTLWQFNIAMEHHNFLMGKSTISTGPCSMSLFVCLPGRVYRLFPFQMSKKKLRGVPSHGMIWSMANKWIYCGNGSTKKHGARIRCWRSSLYQVYPVLMSSIQVYSHVAWFYHNLCCWISHFVVSLMAYRCL